MNTGNPIGDDAEGPVAHTTVLHDAEHPSFVVLPIQPQPSPMVLPPMAF
jgi:hypothetical protein